MIETAVTVNLECAHRDLLDGRLHGHSYTVEVWFRPGPDVRIAKVAIGTITDMVQEKPLEESVGGPLMEDMAAWLMVRLSLLVAPHVTRIVIRRPTLGFACEARRVET